MNQRPERTEAAEYYFTYIDKVAFTPGEGIVEYLARQRDEAAGVCATIDEARASHAYSPGKWSLRQVLSHLNDTERVFAYRALWFARGFDPALPGFDQDVAIASAGADERTWAGHVEEFRVVRSGTIALFANLRDEAWARSGTASGYVFTVRALAFITAGHVAHHLGIIRERYLTS